MMLRMPLALALTAGVFLPAALEAQVSFPQKSPAATVQQTVGLTQVTVRYHRPAVNGRQVWDALVPFEQVWRAGANENTVIEFSTDVTVEGQPLAAGAYGLHMIPGAATWTVIFNADTQGWGSYNYAESRDVLRVKVTPEPAPHTEWLRYELEDIRKDGLVASLRWAELRVPFTIGVDVDAQVLASLREDVIPALAANNWQGWNQAAQYCAGAGINLEEALTWADKAVAARKNFSTLWTRSELLTALGRGDDAASAQGEAMAVATQQDLVQLGNMYLETGRAREAIVIYASLAAGSPEDFEAQNRLAYAYQRGGHMDEAIAAYEKALAMAPTGSRRGQLERILERLRN